MADFDYKRLHTRSFYNKRGEPFACHSIDDERRAKEAGYTTANYVRSKYPTTMYHKKTGETKVIGDLKFSDEINEAKIAELGPDWGHDYVEVPAPPEPVAPGMGGGFDVIAIASLISEMRTMQTFQVELQGVLTEISAGMAQFAAAQNAASERLSVLESGPDIGEAIEKIGRRLSSLEGSIGAMKRHNREEAAEKVAT